MPSIKTLTPILGGRYFHIFNRGINRQPIFFQQRNYDYFLKLLNKFLNDYVDILAYCLIPNHFHLVIKVKVVLTITNFEGMQTVIPKYAKKEKDMVIITNDVEIGKIVSHQFKRLFIAYAMAINKQENRVGSLFDAKFKRLEITTQEYLEYIIFYTHFNPQKHGLIGDFRQYIYSSYDVILNQPSINFCRDFVFELFGGKTDYINYHSVMHEERGGLELE